MKTLVWLAGLVLAVVWRGVSTGVWTARAGGAFVDLGVQITSLNIQGTTFTKLPDGRDVVCSVIRGQPAKLLVFDAVDGKLLHRIPLPGAKGAWHACTASDGSVYAGTDNEG